MAFIRKAMSLAVERCPFSVKPWAFLKVLRDNPNSFAVSSNRFVKACSDPEIASARAVDVSLAPLIAVALMKSCKLIDMNYITIFIVMNDSTELETQNFDRFHEALELNPTPLRDTQLPHMSDN